MKVVLLHQVVYLRDRPGRAVLNRQNAVGAHPLLHRCEHVVKGVHVQNVGKLEHVIARLLGIGALGALASDQRPVGHLLPAGGDGVLKALIERRLRPPGSGGL